MKQTKIPAAIARSRSSEAYLPTSRQKAAALTADHLRRAKAMVDAQPIPADVGLYPHGGAEYDVLPMSLAGLRREMTPRQLDQRSIEQQREDNRAAANAARGPMRRHDDRRSDWPAVAIVCSLMLAGVLGIAGYALVVAEVLTL